MPKKFIKRWTPHPEKIKEYKHLKCLGKIAETKYLWQMHRANVSRACLVGVFVMWIPLPLQTMIVILGAILFKANIPVSVALTFITNPITMPPMIYLNYKIGSLLLGLQPQKINFSIETDILIQQFFDIWKPLLLGTFLVATITSVLSYYLVDFLWKLHLIQRIKNIKEIRLNRKL